ncbi:MAG TPA: spermidine/putrescine ABC transporter substrate-binding protein [Patescibacteria group bacterium]|jgi:spermidine/putrescine transport system substrate-binding protein|nr:spermidine/putrescine ABC transporter substrate-binding protein [Patescibacteria group bacterium]
MTDRHDGSSIDLEKELVRYMVEHRISRRYLLERIALVGGAAALAPIIAACTSSGGSASAAPSSAAPSVAASVAPPSASPSPTAQPSPEGALNILNWTDYLADDVIKSFEDQFSVKVTQSFFSTTDEMYQKIGEDGGDYDISFPISVDVPNMVERGVIAKLDKSMLPNIVNLGQEWANPGYDPGNTYTVPYMWWTTGVGYDPKRVKEEPTSSKALWDARWKQHISMLDDWQEVFGLTLIQQGHSANSTNTAEMDQALALLEQQKPLVRTYSTDTIGTMTSGDVWIGHIWGADRFAIQETIPDFAYYIPEEGGVKGSDTVATFTGSPHPVAAQLFINHLLDAHNSAANTNLIYYMGPNAAAKEFIDPAILSDPTINPDQEIVDKLEELLRLDQSVRDEYLSRWQQLRG